MDKGAQLARVMVVEDEVLLALYLAETVERLGHAVFGPFHTEAEALAALEGDRPDVAFLDINIRGETSVEIARRLAGQEIPFAFLTGYATSGHGLTEEFPTVDRLSKPCDPEKLRDALHKMLGR